MDLLKKIKMMTTNIGIYQHGKLGNPDPKFGYALEDQARALIVAHEFREKNLEEIYLNYIIRSKRADGLLYHFYYENDRGGFFKNKENNSKPNLQEAYGITLWSLLTIQSIKDKHIAIICENLLKDALSWTSPRAISAAILGLVNLNYKDKSEDKLKFKLHNLFFQTRTSDWVWFENYLVYSNAILPWSMWELYLRRHCKTSLEIAKETTDFLLETCQINGVPAPVGNKGWYFKGRHRALYDQQPVDTAYMVCCLEKAYIATKEEKYLSWAKKWYEWFWGNNLKKLSMLDENWACYDALTPHGVNLNQGAESNICFLMAYLAAKRMGFTH